MTREYEIWLAFAEEDLKMARLAIGEGLFCQVCFHAEQCVEKTIKAFYIFSDKTYPKTHKLADLLSHLPGGGFNELQERIIDLDRFYIPTRYPDALPGSPADSLPNESDAREALETAQVVFQYSSKMIAKT
jgi:HEPN domain-containing protein